MATRHANDHYPTPTALTLALLKELPQIGGAIIEPCAAEGKIAAGQNPQVALDSYLEVGEMIGDLALVYDWCNDQVTSGQKSRWIASGVMSDDERIVSTTIRTNSVHSQRDGRVSAANQIAAPETATTKVGLSAR